MESDEDADENAKLMSFSECGCEDSHTGTYLKCVGCNICYIDSVKKDPLLGDGETDYDTEDDIESYQPDHGALRWLCPGCEEMLRSRKVECFVDAINADTRIKKKTNANLNCSGREGILTKLCRETDEIKSTLNEVVSCLKELSPSGFDAKSPKRKAARISFGEDNNVSSLNYGSLIHNDSALRNSTPVMDNADKAISNFPVHTFSDKLKLNIKSKENVLKALHVNRHLVQGVSTTKKKGDGSYDILFNTFKDAQKAKDILDDKLDGAEVSTPSLDGVAKFNLVGFTFKMDKSDVIQSIINENNSWLDVVTVSEDTVSMRNDPCAILTVCDVIKCRNNEVFRVLVTMLKQMLAVIGKHKLSIGFSKCCLYDISNHNRCYNCQRSGHFAKECPHPIACPRCSLEHSVRECQSVCVKCVNCSLHGKDDVNHASYSKLCPYNTS